MEALQPEGLVAHSLHAFQSRDGATPEAAAERIALLAEAELLRCPHEEELAPLLALQQAAAAHRAAAARRALRPRHALRWLQPGRLVFVHPTAAPEEDGGGGEEGAGAGAAPGAAATRDPPSFSGRYTREAGDTAAVNVAAVQKLVSQRDDARAARDYTRADALRDTLTNTHGVQVRDDELKWFVAGKPAPAAGTAAAAPPPPRGWGVLLGVRRADGAPLGAAAAAGAGSDAADDEDGPDAYLVDVLLPCAAGAVETARAGGTPATAALADPAAEAHVLPVRLSAVRKLSAVRLWLPRDLRPLRNRCLVLEAMRQVFCERRFGAIPERFGGAGGDAAEAEGGGVAAGSDGAAAAAAAEQEAAEAEAEEAGAVLSPRELCGSGDAELEVELRQAAEADEQLLALAPTVAPRGAASDCAGGGAREALRALGPRLARLARRRELLRASAELAPAAGGAGAPSAAEEQFAAEMRKMQAVLRQLQCVDESHLVLRKGRAAAEVDASDELLATELLFGGFFNGLSAAAATALCACLIGDQSERVRRPPPPHADLAEKFLELQAAARTMAALYTAHGLPTDERTYVERFDGGMLNVIYAWCGGSTFGELCGMCGLFEGSIIRAIRRLGELLNELQSAAKEIGNDELYLTFSEGAKLIQRDIVYAPSLYLES